MALPHVDDVCAVDPARQQLRHLVDELEIPLREGVLLRRVDREDPQGVTAGTRMGTMRQERNSLSWSSGKVTMRGSSASCSPISTGRRINADHPASPSPGRRKILPTKAF